MTRPGTRRAADASRCATHPVAGEVRTRFYRSGVLALGDELGLHALAVEDAVLRHERPTLDRYPEHLFLSACSVHMDGSTAELVSSSAMCGQRASGTSSPPSSRPACRSRATGSTRS